MLREIRLYGRLSKFLRKRVLRADVASAAEAIRFLLANFPQLEAHMTEHHYRVSVGSYDLSLDELHDPAGQQVIKITPVVAGAGAVGRILAGVALIALTVATGGFGGAAIGLFGAGTIAVSTIAVGIGAALILGGVAELLTPVPKSGKDDQDPRKSFSFSGIQNTSRSGTPVPVVYGETLVGSVVVSSGIETVQVTA